ncbi:MAG TPA: nucleotidyltransferase family protein [Polyangiales bacterium]|nr:nucleotidyltransferase family protein [Polyangiales bacterium]
MSAPEIACALLAAGASTRLGRPKQLLMRAGMPLIVHVLSQLKAAGCAHHAVILGSRAEVIRPVLAAESCELFDNPDWTEGIAASIRLAAAWAQRQRAAALLLAVCDQPRLGAEHARALCAAFAADGCAVASGYSATLGTPAIFPASWYPRLLQLRGDRGAGALLRADPSVRVIDWRDGAIDIDIDTDLSDGGWH